ncbi:MAG: sensor histidine kinase [Deltaproteobacteria bacterium]|nr:sensor histidine kinase [Deltaproteobacteria bacterium]
MSIIKKIKPHFWDHYDATEGFKQPFSFRRKWKLIVILTSIVALTPLLIMTLIDFQLTKRAIESEVRMSMSRTVSNTWQTISFFLAQRKTALGFIVRDNLYEELGQAGRLQIILKNLKEGIGGFEDIGLLDANGNVQAYAGPYDLEGTNVYNDKCFQSLVKHGFYVKAIRNESEISPHLVIAIKHFRPDGSFFVLRSGLDSVLMNNMLSQLEIGDGDDAFIISEEGVLQTPSRFHGGIYDKISLLVPQRISGAKTMEATGRGGVPVFIGYAYIPDTSLILMIVKPKSEMMALWYKPRMKLIGFLVLSIGVVLLAILGTATYLVNRIHSADKKRVEALHQVEYTNKLASLGRLASGVAHEINNPLAIINQKAGLIKDLFTMHGNYASDEKLMGLIKGVLSSVERAGSITRRLLNFARHMDTDIEHFDLGEMVRDVLSLLEKEAEFRSIEIVQNIPEKKVVIESDQGNLQQICLNLINNAFAAMEAGGRLDVTVENIDSERVTIVIADNGHGISHADLKRVFEPFFSTRSGHKGTGLGLSITYGLAQEIGGDIAVESKLGEGTRFIVTLPGTVSTD